MKRSWIEMLGFWAIAAAIAVLAHLPAGTWRGRDLAPEVTGYALPYGTWLIWTAGVVALTVVLALVLGARLSSTLERARRGVTDLPGRTFVLILAGATLILTGLLARFVFVGNPHHVDSVAQLFHARIFAQGHITAPAPDLYEFFAAGQIVRHAGRWFSQYPPGHPAFLAAGWRLGVPWIVGPVFAVGSVLILYATARRLLGEAEARLAGLLFVLSPFALFVGASYMNHVTAGFFLLAALYAAVRIAGSENPGRWPLALGGALAVAATIRPLEAAAWSLVLGVWLIMRGRSGSALKAAFVCAIGLIPLLAYNQATTGSALRFGYSLLWGEGHGLGFHVDPWGRPFTPARSLASTAADFRSLNVTLFGWPFPSLTFMLVALVVAGFGAWRGKARAGGEAGMLTALMIAAPAAYFFYWHRDHYLGPRFLYASVGPLILLTAVGIGWLDRGLERWRPAFRMTVLAGLLIALGTYLPERAGALAGSRLEMKRGLEAAAGAAGVDRALIFVKTGWGSRLIARLWAWGVPAFDVERSFRQVDGCRIQHALGTADSLVATGLDSTTVRQRLVRQLRTWRQQDLPLVRGRLTDRSVRVDVTRPLDEVCREEARRDASGYTSYGNLIWRNDPWLRTGLILARGFGPDRNRRLLQHHAGLAAYLYAPLTLEPGARHVLRPLDLSIDPDPIGASPLGDSAAGASKREGEADR